MDEAGIYVAQLEALLDQCELDWEATEDHGAVAGAGHHAEEAGDTEPTRAESTTSVTNSQHERGKDGEESARPSTIEAGDAVAGDTADGASAGAAGQAGATESDLIGTTGGTSGCDVDAIRIVEPSAMAKRATEAMLLWNDRLRSVTCSKSNINLLILDALMTHAMYDVAVAFMKEIGVDGTSC